MPGERTCHIMTDLENAREPLDFPLSKQLGKIISQRDSQQGKEKKTTMPSETALRFFAQMLVPSFSMGSIWSGEIWPVPPFLFPPVVPRVSKLGTVNQCLFCALVCVADPNSMAGKPGACLSSQSKLNKKTTINHSSPHILYLLTQRPL